MSKEDRFEVGDIVKLKSGGPEMTVNEAIADFQDVETGKYRCQWFAGKKLDNGVFPYESLIAANEES